MRFDKVLLPLDGSDLAEQLLPLLRGEPHEVVLCRVVEQHLPVAPGVATGLGLSLTQPQRERSEVAEAEEYLQAVACTLTGPVRTVVVTGNPADEIVRTARTLDVDLIVMASHGRGGPKRWLLGSVAERVVRRAPCPVLIYPPAAQHSVADGDPE